MTEVQRHHDKILKSDQYAFRNVEFPVTSQTLPMETLDIIDVRPTKSSTFFARARGNSMSGAGIFSGDLLALDSSIEPCHGHVVLAQIYGGYTLKRYHQTNGVKVLLPENNQFKPIHIPQDSNFRILGVVVYNIHRSL